MITTYYIYQFNKYVSEHQRFPVWHTQTHKITVSELLSYVGGPICEFVVRLKRIV